VKGLRVSGETPENHCKGRFNQGFASCAPSTKTDQPT
jgi:hypothetical protein